MKEKFRYVEGIKIPNYRYFKTKSNNYVTETPGGWFVIRKGELKFEMYFAGIKMAEIDATEITEEEFNEALQKSKDGVEGYH